MKHCVSCGQNYDAQGWTCPECGFEPVHTAGIPSFVGGLDTANPAEFNQRIYERMMRVETYSFYFLARQALILWALEHFFPQRQNYYDFGVGTGFMLSKVHDKWPEMTLFASDLAGDSLAITEKRVSDATLFHTDADHIPFRDHFDVICAFDVIEHIDDDVACLRALLQAAKPGGGLLITVPQHMFLWSSLDESTGHRRRYVGNNLARNIREAGFEVLMDTSFMASMLLPQYVSRRFFSQNKDAEFESEHSLPAPVNAALKAVLAAELLTIKLGVCYPFGGMRLVAARRPANP